MENMSLDTRKQYRHWVERFLNFVSTHARNGSAQDKFNAWTRWHVNQKPQPSLSNQKQAHFAIKYFYRKVLMESVDDVDVPTGKRSQKTFNVLTRPQIRALIDALPEEYRLIARLLYGTGMRIDECLSLRVKDIDFEHKLIYVQEGKGDKARRVDLPEKLAAELLEQINYANSLYHYDRTNKKEGVYLPHMYGEKNPKAATAWEWYWLFPNPNEGTDPDTGIKRRHHVYDFAIQKAFKVVRTLLNLPIYTTPKILRHCYATHYLEGVLRDLPPIPNIGRFARDLLREKMGHVSAETTDIYIHLAMPKNAVVDRSPYDELE